MCGCVCVCVCACVRAHACVECAKLKESPCLFLPLSLREDDISE